MTASKWIVAALLSTSILAFSANALAEATPQEKERARKVTKYQLIHE